MILKECTQVLYIRLCNILLWKLSHLLCIPHVGVCAAACPNGTWADESDWINGVSGASPYTCVACSSLCVDGCTVPTMVTASHLAGRSVDERTALTAASCSVGGPMGCRSGVSVYNPYPMNVGGIEINGTCVGMDACPPATYANTATHECTACDSECLLGCSAAGAKQCLVNSYTGLPACRNYFVTVDVVSMAISTPQCVASCPPPNAAGGWHEVRVNGRAKCVPCSATCQVLRNTSTLIPDDSGLVGSEAYACTGTDSASCFKCAFAEQRTRLTSSQAYVCVSACAPGYELQNMSFAVDFGHVPGPNRYVSDFVCVECPLKIVESDICVTSCAEHTLDLGFLYQSDPGMCRYCDPTCALGCNGPLASNCIGELGQRCRNVSAMIDGIVTCVDDCAQHGQYVGVDAVQNAVACQACPSECNATSTTGCCLPPVGGESATCGHVTFDTCIACHPACDGCTGAGTGNCISCHTAVFNGTCVLACPQGYFKDPTDNTCRACHETCGVAATCSGPTPFNCSVCAAISYNGECRASCPRGTMESPPGVAPTFPVEASLDPPGRTTCVACHVLGYFQDSNGTCVACSNQCTEGGTCVGPAADECLPVSNRTCKFFKHANGSCIQACPANTYKEFHATGDNLCLPCSPLCAPALGCAGSGPQQCASCRYKQLLDTDGVCLATCPEGHYSAALSNLCRPCSPLCTECTGPTAAQCGNNCTSNAVYEEDLGCAQSCSAGKIALADNASVVPTCA